MPYVVDQIAGRSHLSFTQLNTVARCGEAYRRRYIQGDGPLFGNIPALVGSAFHVAVVDFEVENRGYLSVATGSELALTKQLVSLTKAYLARIKSEINIDEDNLLHFGKQDIHWFLREGIEQMATNYVSLRLEEEARGTRLIDSELEVKVEVKGRTLLAFIDQLLLDAEGRWIIRDLKTGKPKQQDAMQLEIYRFAYHRSRGDDAEYGQLLYLKGSAPKVHTSRFTLSDADCEEVVGALIEAAENERLIINGPFTGECDICDYRPDCPWGGVAIKQKG